MYCMYLLPFLLPQSPQALPLLDVFHRSDSTGNVLLFKKKNCSNSNIQDMWPVRRVTIVQDVMKVGWMSVWFFLSSFSINHHTTPQDFLMTGARGSWPPLLPCEQIKWPIHPCTLYFSFQLFVRNWTSCFFLFRIELIDLDRNCTEVLCPSQQETGLCDRRPAGF